jgi:hypothetical protein
MHLNHRSGRMPKHRPWRRPRKGILQMTMLTHGFDRTVDPSERREAVKDTAGAQLSAIKRFALCALTVLLAGGALAGVIALKTALVFWRFHF